ncbi:MAG TPA: methyltransferase domain-containing protein [Terracidiphilus sp.]|nr:methyltransferase domain-containing protein [Terracidiphilus sp.]
MTQTWDAKAYGEYGAFVHGLAGGVLEWLAVRAGEEVLDLGCGDGQLTNRIAAAGARVRGVDASPAMADAARARGVAVDVANAELLPYPEASFDAVFSNAALHWVQDQDAMMREVRRVLRPGGRFVAEMGGQGNIAAIRVALTAVLERHGAGNLEEGVNCYPTPSGYTRRLAGHGLRVDRMVLIPRPTPLGEGGMDAWLRTFRRGVLEAAPAAQREAIVRETVELLKPALCDEEGNWVADYVRLRFAATAV